MVERNERAQLVVQVNEYLPPQVRRTIERDYYAQVNERASLEHVIRDESFVADPTAHVALFSDHGVVHARDVSRQILQVLNAIHGVLIPARDRERLRFMGGYGVIVAYLHDIGMRDFSAFGRAMHPEFAAQAVYAPELDGILEPIWETNCGNVAWRLLNASIQGLLSQDPRLVLREMLAMSLCHSKSKAPIETLNDFERLRALMQRGVSTDLQHLYHQQQVSKSTLALSRARERKESAQEIGTLAQRLERAKGTQQRFLDAEACPDPFNHALDRHYDDFEGQSFAWLLSASPAICGLACDVVDTLRALRAADALRQRGTLLKTSAAYEILVDRNSAHAVYALRSRENSNAFFVEAQGPISAGEANLASSELDRDGNLRVSFHHGAFSTPEAVRWAAHSVAVIIDDIQADVIVSFSRDASSPDEPLSAPGKTYREIEILVEGVDDNPRFASLVCQALREINPEIGDRARPAPSFQNADPAELERYLNGDRFEWSAERRYALLKNVFGDADEDSQHMDLVRAFVDAKLIQLKAGEMLFEAGSRSGFVYIPFAEGLRVFPLGGYMSVHSPAWVPIGNTGAIRGSARNATVVAERSVEVLMLPKQVYTEHWYRTYCPAEIPRLFQNVDSFLVWKEQYSVHIPRIDDQHKRLFALYRELGEAMEAGQSSAALTTIFSRLVEYTQLHFADEEQLQRAAGYPGYEAHKQLHDDLVDHVKELEGQFRQGDIHPVQTSMFLREWLVHHILELDRGYGPFVQGEGVQ